MHGVSSIQQRRGRTPPRESLVTHVSPAKPMDASPGVGLGGATRSQSVRPKILLYSHDTFGLGNIRRTLLLCEAIRQEYVSASILIVTGSPMIHAFRIPEGVDYVKLPCLDRTDAEHYEPRFLAARPDEVNRVRRAVLEESILGFSPDLMIVDKRAGGVDGELLETLRALRQAGSTRLVLGIRDILDEPERTRRSLERSGAMDTIARYYDEVWIYGERSIFDPVKEYAFPEAVARRTYFCGYLKRPTQVTERNGGPPRVLVTTGGGGDGSDLIQTYLDGLASLPRRIALRTTVVFGPQMAPACQAAILERYGTLADVTFVDFEADLTQRYAESDVVVSMAGYNTVCELLSFGRRAVLVPRAEPVGEQLLRARLFAARGYLDLVEPQDLDPGILIAKVLAALEDPRPPAPEVDLEGLPRIRQRVRRLLEEPRR
jgi:predicted glycosyltransferase